MKKISKLIITTAVMACAVGMTAFAANDSTEIKGPGKYLVFGPGPAKLPSQMTDTDFVTNLKVAETTNKLVVVVGQEGANVVVTYHEKAEDGTWSEVLRSDGYYGRQGSTTEKREGDQKTPIGVYSFTTAFGLLDDPGCAIPYHKVQSGDYWVDDSASSNYNKLVNTKTTAKNWNSAENLAAASPYYNYALALNYNESCTPGMGSAIFLHCIVPGSTEGTSGCVKVPEAIMKQIMQKVDAGSKILIVPDEASLANY